MDKLALWQRYREYLCECGELGIQLDVSRMGFPEDFLGRMQPAMGRAFAMMRELEAGAIANPDEKRMVGHYWLRAPELAPQEEIARAIRQAQDQVRDFAQKVHRGQIAPVKGGRFTDVLVIGIGGSALGPQLVADALGGRRDRMRMHFLDNTDPDGFDRVFRELGARVGRTLVVVISKSGTTPETRNGMVETAAYLRSKGLELARQAVAVTCPGSRLDQQAQEEGWLGRFPMWEWVGGRTSLTSAVGLLPAALQGVEIDQLLAGAAEMDRLTRREEVRKNPAAMLALMWYWATGGRGEKDMVILPYKDRLVLFSRYLQQLVMESLGKEKDLAGNIVHQGISVYGNKGSTDQHAYVQQLREGVNNFFVTFIVVLEDRLRQLGARRAVVEVEEGISSGDYLVGFWQGTRQALWEAGRSSMTITLETLDARRLGALVALYERAVGLYAGLININAYHQPGVEAGKKAAAAVLAMQRRTVEFLKSNPGSWTTEEIAQRLGAAEEVETIWHVLEHLAVNRRGVVRKKDRFSWKG